MTGFEDPSVLDDEYTLRAKRRIGNVLRGKWRIDSVLGVGGMASVYAATHRNGKRGAVKVLHGELAMNQSARSRFLREGYVANTVDHPGAVSVLDDDVTEAGEVYIVMELLDGESVGAYAARAPGHRIALGEALAIGEGVLEVLVAAHAKGIVHRDLKPENLFVTRRGELKVLDFGIARMLEASNRTHATKTGAPLGTPDFMPPEQALGNWDQVDGRTDLWATAATLFALATGRVVHHKADTMNKLLLAAMTEPAPPIASVMPDIDGRFAHLVDKGLRFNREERWRDAEAMLEALKSVAASVPGVGLPQPATAAGARSPRSAEAPAVIGPATPTAMPATAMPPTESASGIVVDAAPASVPRMTPTALMPPAVTPRDARRAPVVDPLVETVQAEGDHPSPRRASTASPVSRDRTAAPEVRPGSARAAKVLVAVLAALTSVALIALVYLRFGHASGGAAATGAPVLPESAAAPTSTAAPPERAEASAAPEAEAPQASASSEADGPGADTATAAKPPRPVPRGRSAPRPSTSAKKPTIYKDY